MGDFKRFKKNHHYSECVSSKCNSTTDVIENGVPKNHDIKMELFQGIKLGARQLCTIVLKCIQNSDDREHNS